jgi:hypothetical protein
LASTPVFAAGIDAKVPKTGNKRNMVSYTPPKITSGDYYIQSLGDVTVSSESLVSDGSKYSIRLSKKYTDPSTHTPYSQYITYTLYNSQLYKLI